MNFRFAANSIRVRISSDELSQLRDGRALSLEVCLTGHHVFKARLSLSTDSQWHFDSDPTGMWMTVPRTEIEALTASLPSKEGIEHSFETSRNELVVSLEVDVKRRG
ncbi:MAG TPA: hypothetical protein VHL14_01660 [Steroidobacteraceae bacterium]|jgi:hypothetical protein|nr:hypothetical protein [Steroidobacteraceae bacterium]